MFSLIYQLAFYFIFRLCFSFRRAQPYEIMVSKALMIRERERFEILTDFYAEGVVNLLIPEVSALNNRSIAEQSGLGCGFGVGYK